MRFHHFLIILYLGIILGSVLILFFGNEGYFAYHLYKEHREVLLDNIENLKKKNEQLKQKIKLLRSHPDLIRILARKLGYYEEGENLIFLKGDLSMNNHYEIGNIVNKMKSGPNRNLILRIIGFSVSIFCVILVILIKHRNISRKSIKRKRNDREV